MHVRSQRVGGHSCRFFQTFAFCVGLFVVTFITYFDTDTALYNENVQRFLSLNLTASASANETQLVESNTLSRLRKTGGAGGAFPNSNNINEQDEQLIDMHIFESDHVYKQLLEKGESLISRQGRLNHSLGIVVEVGMHHIKQCAKAAQVGFSAHCFEPSSASFERITEQLQRLETLIQRGISLYNVAVGATSGDRVAFSGDGGTGDHVGQGIDAWKMTRSTPSASATSHNLPTSSDVVVETMKLDDVISKQGQVFIAKIDTQGYEPAVFGGLAESIRKRKLSFILFEYWPKGMDLMSNYENGHCVAAEILVRLADAGYRLIALHVMTHPQAGPAHKAFRSTRPMTGFKKNCQWYYELEQQINVTDYYMGYWSDILAVAPGAEQLLGNEPVSDFGKALLNELTTSTTAVAR
ncbi:hypothetical protein MPSEU_000544300 [Mayamaea pseudoterrestris]|nr:hypothetical protein MPSEU_000544300 [Mayamaea pseudoterrestris]